MILLLDVHVPRAVAVTLRKRRPDWDVQHISAWHEGQFRTASDEQLLSVACTENRTLITYDQKTIPGLLRPWAAEQRDHSGVIFVDHHTIPAANIGQLATAMIQLLDDWKGLPMTNVVLYLHRPKP